MKRGAAILVLALVAGCGGGPAPEAAREAPAPEPEAKAEPTPAPEVEPPAAAPEDADAVLLYLGGSAQAAMICVRKKIGDTWREKKFTVLPRNEEKGATGEIGKVVQETDSETGEPVDRDYGTGCVLLSISKEKFTPPGEPARDRYRIRYRDARGVEKDLWMSEGGVPKPH